MNHPNKTFYNQILSILLGSFLGIFILIRYQAQNTTVGFDELALGEATQSLFAEVDGVRIHCSDLEDAEACIEGYNAQKRRDLILWLGNSQIHAINQMQETDETAAFDLHRKFKQHEQYFVTFSQPNASLQEHYILFEYLIQRLPVQTLILPVVFDDMRESGIRPGLADVFTDPNTQNRLGHTSIGQALLSTHSDKDAAGNDMAALDDTAQEQVERYLNDQLASSSTLWKGRPASRGQLFTDLYLFRNWLLGINPSSIRKVIPANYKLNIEAFEAILDTAQEHNIVVLTYIVPLRNDVAIPYEPTEYQAFKTDIANITSNRQVQHIDLENLVPAEYWGVKNATTVGGGVEIDFMHFQAPGHRLLAEELYNNIAQ